MRKINLKNFKSNRFLRKVSNQDLTTTVTKTLSEVQLPPKPEPILKDTINPLQLFISTNVIHCPRLPL